MTGTYTWRVAPYWANDIPRQHAELQRVDPAHVAAVRYDLHVPQSRSLMAKRAAVRPIVEL